MHNVTPARVMVRRARQFFLMGIVVLLAGLVLGALGLFFVVIRFSLDAWYGLLQAVLLFGGLLVSLAGVGLLIRSLTYPADNETARRMAEVLGRGFDQRYTYIRNISRRGLGYIDAVLLGPNGALIFYFVNEPGIFLCERDVWLRQRRGELYPWRHSPTREVVKDVDALRRFLAGNGLETMPVFAVIVFTQPAARVTVREPLVPVAQVNHLLPVLHDNYLAQERVSPREVNTTIELLLE